MVEQQKRERERKFLLPEHRKIVFVIVILAAHTHTHTHTRVADFAMAP